MSGHHDPGHTVLAVPVPPLEQFVRARTVHYDAEYLSAEPGFAHAHVTVLAPWRRAPGPADLEAVAQVCARTRPFTFTTGEVATFPDGTIHLTLVPDAGFREMTSRLRSAFNDVVPYEGRFGEHLVPHVTLDAVGADVDEAVVRAWTAPMLPATALADRLQLQWWQAGRCHVQHEWTLGTEGHR
ncbi:MAG: 2'-5' RNA ligase family protein [Nocardioides sp.]|uniref:2'-5' RNA ligase family protein n=1 Tax=Nocardioides sp. TaxID=35761 RepID=UPI003F04BDA0